MDACARRALQKRINYVKVIYLFLDVGADVLVRTLEVLYEGPKPLEAHLVALSKVKSNNICPAERRTLELLRGGGIQLSGLDITLLYKLIQVSCGLTDKTSPEGALLWSKNCPKEKQDSLEFLLFRYKDARNEIIHEFQKMKTMTDHSFNDIKINGEILLMSIINEVGKRSGLSTTAIYDWQRKICGDMNFICQWNLIDNELPLIIKVKSESFSYDADTDDEFKSMDNFDEKWFRNLTYQDGTPKSVMSEPTSNSTFVDKFSDLPREGMKTIKSYTLKRDILDQYEGETLPKFFDWQMGNPNLSEKCDRNLWINRLLTMNILEDDASLQQFLEEYSMKEQIENNWISDILCYFKTMFGF